HPHTAQPHPPSSPTRRSSDLFAMSRTLYPLVTINYEAGNEDGNSVNKTLSTREENAKFPALTEYMEKNGLVHEIKSVDDSRALRSEEHTSELQSRENLVCRLL